ncbi:hypothetical protein Esti_002683 [Eimeria stiedai]
MLPTPRSVCRAYRRGGLGTSSAPCARNLHPLAQAFRPTSNTCFYLAGSTTKAAALLHRHPGRSPSSSPPRATHSLPSPASDKSSSSSRRQRRLNPKLSLLSPEVSALETSQQVLTFALRLPPCYIYSKHDLLLLLQQLTLLQPVKSSSSSFKRFWDRAFPVLVLHRTDGLLLRLALLRLSVAKCRDACLDLLPLVKPHLNAYSVPELADLLWHLAHLSLPPSRPAPAAADNAAAAAAANRASEFKGELLLQLYSKQSALERHLFPQQQQQQRQQQLTLVYRLVYAAAKLRIRATEAPEFFAAVGNKATELLRRSCLGEGLGFRVWNAAQLVRVVWSCAALQLVNRDLYAAARKQVLSSVDDYSFEELQILLQVFQAVNAADPLLVEALEKAKQQIASLCRESCSSYWEIEK